MYEAIGLKEYGTWIKKGHKCFVGDSLIVELARDGYVKVLKYHVTKATRQNIKPSLIKLKHQKRVIDLKIKGYELYLKKQGVY